MVVALRWLEHAFDFVDDQFDGCTECVIERRHRVTGGRPDGVVLSDVADTFAEFAPGRGELIEGRLDGRVVVVTVGRRALPAARLEPLLHQRAQGADPLAERLPALLHVIAHVLILTPNRRSAALFGLADLARNTVNEVWGDAKAGQATFDLAN